jgi:hypothetical protein
LSRIGLNIVPYRRSNVIRLRRCQGTSRSSRQWHDLVCGRQRKGCKKRRRPPVRATLFKSRTVRTYLSAAVHHGVRCKTTPKMADGQVSDKYHAATVAALELSLSADRLSSYMLSASGDKQKAILLHELNTQKSEALFGVIQGLELTFRNAVHRILEAGIGVASWYDKIALKDSEADALEFAKNTLVRKHKPRTASRIVAQLNFGFWVRLTSGDYEKVLWVPHIHKIFPRKMKRSKLNARLIRIKDLRNKIAHHERITDRDLQKEYEQILKTIAWLCPVTSAWVRDSNRFEDEPPAPPNGSAAQDHQDVAG